jgi:hypothetical protein
MAREYEAYTRRGATVAAIVIDAPEQNAAMVEKLAIPFPILSDPDGERAIKPLGVWDEEGKMATPAIIVLAPDGHEVYRYAGVDFMDRPNDDEILDALSSLGLPTAETSAGTIAHLAPRPGSRATKLDNLAVYMRGVRFASMALAGRARDPFDQAEAERTSRMAERYIAAQGATLRLVDQHAT